MSQRDVVPRRSVRQLAGRVLARVLAEDVKEGPVASVKSTSCGSGCDEIVNDSWKFNDDSY
jgi:hypothetical protein